MPSFNSHPAFITRIYEKPYFSYAAGGLVGENFGIIERCFSSAPVDGRGNDEYMSGETGGLVGFNYGTIQDCYATGEVIGQNAVGGLVGVNAVGHSGEPGDYGIIENSYSTGRVTGVDEVGGLVGVNLGGVIASYWNVPTSGMETSAAGEGRSIEQMTYPHDEETYVGWDFNSVWAADTDGSINGGYPYLAEDSGGLTEFTLRYFAAEGGHVTGDIIQVVEPGGSGTRVTAVADEGAVFDGWSDGVSTHERTDENVQGNISVTAYFSTTGGVEIDWYGYFGITPGESQTWADLDHIDWTGKGMTLREEFIAGTNPGDARSRFGASATAPNGDGFSIEFEPNLEERLYSLWRSTNLVNWQIVPGMENRAGGNGPLVDTDPPAGKVFYRVEVKLP